MKKFALAGLATLFAAAPALAQSSDPCAGVDARARDACQVTVDVFGFMTPQLGVSLAGGNALLGARSNIGGLGHFSLGVRVTAIQGKLPDLESVTFNTTGASTREIDATDQILGAPGAEVAVGIFRGVDLGFARVGSLEGIVSANYIPEYDDDNFTVEAPDGSLKLGFGGRLGIIGEGAVLPGLSVTYLRRDLPTLNVNGITGTPGDVDRDTLELRGFSVKTTAIRAVVQKSLPIISLAAGIGQDQYEADARLRVFVQSGGTNCNIALPCSATVDYASDMTRTTMFANLTLNLKIMRIGAEVGQVSGGDVTTRNTFTDRDANDSLPYGSVAIRFGW